MQRAKTTNMLPSSKVLCILYSSGGTADVGRHAVRAALDKCPSHLRILTADPATLEETNWNCACGEHKFTKEERDRLDIRKVDFTKEDFGSHLDNCSAVISALGNRQPFYGDRVGTEGIKRLVDAMEQMGYRASKDLEGAENTLMTSSLDYLIIRPVGLGEEEKPKGEWFVQKEKHKDKLGFNMSKLDCARFAVTEVLNPTYHRRAVVVGNDPKTLEPTT